MAGMGRAAEPRFLRVNQSQQFFYLPAYGDACGSPCGRDYCFALGRAYIVAAPPDRGTADCGGHCGLVLALHVSAVGLCVCAVSVCEIARTFCGLTAFQR